MAAVLAVAGVVTLGSGGIVLASEETAAAEPAANLEKIGVCHRTASESNPYVYLSVPSEQANGHITGTDKQHHQQVVWQADGSWRGVTHRAGDPRLDYFASSEEIAAGRCFDTTQPTTEPTTEPTEEPTTEPTEEPTTEPTEEPTEEPTTEPTEEPTEEPSDEPTTPRREDVKGDDATADDAAEPSVRAQEQTQREQTDAPTVPRRVHAGAGETDAATLWGSGLLGGGTAMLVSAGGVAVGARRFEEA